MRRWGLAGGRAGPVRRMVWLLLVLLLIVIPALDLASATRAAHGSSCPLHGNPMLAEGTAAPHGPRPVSTLLLPESPKHRSLARSAIFIPPRA